jgi:NAD+ synthetase
MAFDSEGKMIAFGNHFEEDFIIVDIDMENQGIGVEVTPPKYIEEEETFKALVLGTRDYCKKTGFSKGVIGLSGGIDSSLTASIATEALGKENVLGVSMPSQYSSEHSKEDAKRLAKNLGIRHAVVPIEGIFEAFKGALAEQFKDMAEDVAEENLQARIRGTILMALSNKFGHIVFTTGNKTELALGYCTLYGDMAGGLGIISDLSKMQVYELADYYNRLKDKLIIPKRVFDKIPSAELKKDQYDPFDYSVVSPLVDEIIENGKTRDELIELGYAQTLVDEIIKRIRSAEYKRRQAPPGIKITSKAFGIGRKMPIVNKYF